MKVKPLLCWDNWCQDNVSTDTFKLKLKTPMYPRLGYIVYVPPNSFPSRISECDPLWNKGPCRCYCNTQGHTKSYLKPNGWHPCKSATCGNRLSVQQLVSRVESVEHRHHETAVSCGKGWDPVVGESMGELQVIVFNEISQAQEHGYHVLPTCGISQPHGIAVLSSGLRGYLYTHGIHANKHMHTH